MRTKSIVALGVSLLLILVWFLGPAPEKPVYNHYMPIIDSELHQLSDSIDKAEHSNSLIKINNEARILWADSIPKQTEWAIVYLHGFSASQMEGHPVHIHTARHFGMNLYLARLSDHGLESDSALVDFTPDRVYESAKRALAIGNRIGKHVILMSTSTGGTLALKLAEQYPDMVHALINYSPNVRINNALAWMLNNHWGGDILSLTAKNGYINTQGREDSVISQYWNTHYRMEALPQLEELVETTMKKPVFKTITCPSLTIAYYKDKNNQDPTVKVSAMRWMHKNLGTKEENKRFVELPDVGVHPLASDLRSKDIKAVEHETNKFIEEVLNLRVRSDTVTEEQIQ